MCPHRPPPFKCKGDGPAVPSPGPKIDDLVTSTRPTIKTVISEATGLGKTAYTKCIGLTGELPKITQGTAVSACKQAAGTAADQAKAGCNTAAEAGVHKGGGAVSGHCNSACRAERIFLYLEACHMHIKTHVIEAFPISTLEICHGPLLLAVGMLQKNDPRSSR